MSDGRTWGSVIGGVAAYFTGGLSLVATGVAVGGAVGGLLEPKKRTETNRIDDIKVSLSKYGDGIPETWGNNIPSATCVWSTYVIELPEEAQGGKGGGVENTNYRQFIQSMWCLGKTPEDQSTPILLRRAWIDGKLNYDASSGLSAGQALATEENPWASIALLPGYDDQLPVPMIETYEGVGNVPAFRGRICLFIFGLECPGGRVPQLQFELCIGGVTTAVVMYGEEQVVESASVYTPNASASRVDVGGNPIVAFVEDGKDEGDLVPRKLLRTVSLGLDYVTTTKSAVYNLAYNYRAVTGTADIDAICVREVPATTYTDTGVNIVIDAEGNEHRFNLGTGFKVYGESNSRWSKFGDRIIFSGDENQGSLDTALFDWSSGELLGTAVGLEALDSHLTANFLWSLVDVAGTLSFNLRSSEDLANVVTSALPAEFQASTNRFVPLLNDSLRAWIQLGGSSAIYTISADTFGNLTYTEEFSTTETLPIFPAPVVGLKGAKAMGFDQQVVGTTVELSIFLVDFGAVSTVQAEVSDFIESQCLRAGLSADQFDVSTIDDQFHGLTIKSPGSSRANIAPLLTYSAIGVVEEDQLLRFFNRKDKTSVVTVPYEDLGFAEDGSEPGDPFPLVRTNAQELPRSITLSYNDPNFDYQISTVKAMRYAVDSVLDVNETLDMAMSGDRAATIVYRLMFERWLAQNTRSCAVSRKYAANSAGDVVTILSKTGSYGDWMLSKVTDTGVRIEWEMFPADSELLIQVVPGPQDYRAQVIEPIPSPTRQQPLDIPILRDDDNNPGIYVALDSFGPGGRGAALYVGDDDASLQYRGGVTSYAPIGITESALDDFDLNVIDEASTVVVNMGDDELSGITYDVMMSTNANYAAIGAPGRWELIQFKTPSSLGGGRYLLSTFLRGRQGTEHNRGNHEAGDIFVLLLAPGMLRPNMDVGSLNQAKRYRAVSTGRSLNSVASQSYTNTGEGLRPYSPINLLHDLDGDDIVFTWDRRTRLSNNWLIGIVPLGEAVERYELVLYTDSTFETVLRVIASTTDTATYTLAQQTVDGYTPGDPLYVRVYQISDSVGRGHPLEAIQ